jgi:hypothetical protein
MPSAYRKLVCAVGRQICWVSTLRAQFAGGEAYLVRYLGPPDYIGQEVTGCVVPQGLDELLHSRVIAHTEGSASRERTASAVGQVICGRYYVTCCVAGTVTLLPLRLPTRSPTTDQSSQENVLLAFQPALCGSRSAVASIVDKRWECSCTSWNDLLVTTAGLEADVLGHQEE